jgi:putative SOS response-associated peptidase YedK
MCARYELLQLLGVRDTGRFRSADLTDPALWGTDRPDIRPTQIVPVITADRELVGMWWGLVPHWASEHPG